MKSLKNNVIAILVLLSVTFASAQIKNSETKSVKIYGNCEMCKKRIEKAGNLMDIAKVDWNVDSKMATLNFDTSKTSEEEILDRIATAGYESEKHVAYNAAYNKLPKCCQYDKPSVKKINN